MGWDDYIPVWGQLKHVAVAAKDGIHDLYNSAKNAYNAPYEQKAQGLDAVRAEAERIKQERIARQKNVYGQANAQYDDSRRAMKALYGDPTSWRL